MHCVWKGQVMNLVINSIEQCINCELNATFSILILALKAKLNCLFNLEQIFTCKCYKPELPNHN